MRGINHRQAPPALSLLPDGPGSSVLGAGILAGSFGETLTFSRAGAKGLTTGAGSAVVVASGAPAVGPQGLLIERSYTNLCLSSQTLSGNGWASNASGTANTISTNELTAPDGTTTASVLSMNTAFTSANWSAWQVGGASYPDDGVYTFTIWMKAGTLSSIPLQLGTFGGGAGSTSTVCALTSEWQRFTAQVTTSGGPSGVLIQIGNSGAFADNTFAAGDFAVWGASLEFNGYAHSLAPTTTDAVTQPVDVASLPGGSVPLAAGEVSLEFTPLWSSPPGICALFDCRDPDSDSGLLAYVNGADSVVWRVSNNGTTPDCQFPTPTWVQGQTYRFRFVWGAGGTAIYRDGVLVGSGSGIAPTHAFNTALYLGTDYTSGNGLDGYISNFKVRAL